MTDGASHAVSSVESRFEARWREALHSCPCLTEETPVPHAHPIVVIGDSLSQGFMSGAIHRPDLSWPALVARALGHHESFRFAPFDGQGGLPLNLEMILQRVSERCGKRIQWWELVPALIHLREILDDIEDHWETGRGTWPLPARGVHHNLSVWGFELGDADSVTEGVCRRHIPKPKDNLLKQIPEWSMYRTARHVLNPGFHAEPSEWSQVRNAIELGCDGGIGSLIVWLGANNALGTVTSLDIKESEDADLDRLPHERKCNLYFPEHFDRLFARVTSRLAQVEAERVFLVTVPHVTIPPVTRGVSPNTGGRDEDGYYEFYTRPWVWDRSFDERRHPNLTGAEAKKIDSYIDRYNETIRAAAGKRSNWHVIDACAMLDSLAFRRSGGLPKYEFPRRLVRALRASEKLSYLVDDDGTVRLDTRFLMVRDENLGRLAKGGLFSLDGIHPTTIGYGLMADLVLREMKKVGAVGPKKKRLDWDAIVASDTLVGSPPALLANLRDALTFLDKRGQMSRLLEVIGGMAE